MNAIKWLIVSLSLILSAGLAAPVAARPAHTICADELSNLTIPGDLIVPEGTHCELITVTILGHVRVDRQATLEAIGSRIDGALTGSHFERVSLQDSHIGGLIRLSGGASTEIERITAEKDVRLVEQVDMRILQSRVTGDLVMREAREVAIICGTTVEGNARFAEHRGGLLIGDDPTAPATCSTNEVWGNLRVHHNRSDTIVANTTVGQDLICVANDPAPIVYANQVGGNTRGQCGAGEPVDISDLGEDA